MKQTITAKDVAKLAGVSQSSVSRVYFEGARVSAKTREKVLAAAKELDYRPNEFARSLITNRTKIIGLVMKGIQNPFYPQVLKQFTMAFKQHGFSVLFVHTNNDELQSDDIETLLNYNVAGVVITDATMSLKVAETFKQNKIPLVFFNRKLENSDFYSVCCNNRTASQQIAKYLLSKGATELAYIAGNSNTSTSLEREKGFYEILEQNQVTFSKYSSDYTYEGGYQIANEMVDEKQLPSAIFVANDIMALGVIDAMREHALKIPEDLKIIGFDNIEMASWPAYQLTTWEQPIEKMVEATVEYLLNEINDYTGFAKTIEIEGVLIERKTT
ncbi:DNA-binding LacI/PurR family transcriptional regulator [Planomicrobium soli]|uniref:DNA-binding LacI/PurR family transcriptional regulator n=1 Tax=Planomicrobium soli TaxID=1176648 RepID=A0A2P8GCK6_9BACL|nr:LacI family DNA-binding transcriptional regulator [Planomicrobium soli]PSL31677.1 DNA-binding LacI/PurR family transcriptional regulator [Planomicrobium soli]